MSENLDTLVQTLRLEKLDKNLFKGVTWPVRWKRVFGGQVLAQSMYAAIQTIDDIERRVHSQHAYFLRPGDPNKPIIYEVDPIRDGRSFSTRRVVAIQDGQAIFNTSMSFQVPEVSDEYQAPMPEVIAPEEIENDNDFYRRLKHGPDTKSELESQSIDYRTVDKIDFANPKKREPRLAIWMRANGDLPEDRSIHETLLTYMSDRYLMGTAMLPLGLTFENPDLMVASLDHGLWFHDDFRADQWLFYELSSTRASRARGMNFRQHLYSRWQTGCDRRAGRIDANAEIVSAVVFPCLVEVWRSISQQVAVTLYYCLLLVTVSNMVFNVSGC